MTLPIEWNDILNIPEDTSSVRIDRHDSAWKQILAQITILPQLTHLEFGKEITSAKFIEDVLESNVMANVEHLHLLKASVPDFCWSQLRALQSLHIQCAHPYTIYARSFPSFRHFTVLTSLKINEMPSFAAFNQITPHLPQLTALNVGQFLRNDEQLLLEPIWKMTRLRELKWNTGRQQTWSYMLNGLFRLDTLRLNSGWAATSIPWLGTSTLRSLTLCGNFCTENVLPALTNMSQLTQLTLRGDLQFQQDRRVLPEERMGLLKPIEAMYSLASFTLQKTDLVLHLTDWIQHLPASLQSLRLAHVFSKQELDWQEFDKFTQLTLLECDHIGRRLWSDLDDLWPQLPTTLTSLTLKALQMQPGWMYLIPDLPHLTWLSVLESTTITWDPYPSLPALMDAFATLYDKFPELKRLQREFPHGVREEWMMLQQYRKRQPLTFWASHPLLHHHELVALKAKEQSLRRDAALHGFTL